MDGSRSLGFIRVWLPGTMVSEPCLWFDSIQIDGWGGWGRYTYIHSPMGTVALLPPVADQRQDLIQSGRSS